MTIDNTASDHSENDNMTATQIGRSGIFVPRMGNGTLAWGDKRFGFGTAYDRGDLSASTQRASTLA